MDVRHIVMVLITFQAASASREVIHLSSRNIRSTQKTLQQATKGPSVIYFKRQNCPFCSYLTPHFEALAQNNRGKAAFIVVNVDTNDTYKKQYGFSTYPTVVYQKNRQVVAKHGSENKTMTTQKMLSFLKRLK